MINKTKVVTKIVYDFGNNSRLFGETIFVLLKKPT